MDYLIDMQDINEKGGSKDGSTTEKVIYTKDESVDRINDERVC